MTPGQLSRFERRRIGRTDIEATAISFGGNALGGRGAIDTDENAVATVRQAWEAGINYVDVAPAYGESERRFGLAFRTLGGRPPGLFLSTKTSGLVTGDYSMAGTRRSVENSLRLLGQERVDIVYVHEPQSMDPVLAPGGALEALEELRAEGKLRWIGLGARGHELHRQAIRSGRFDVLLTYADYNLVRQTATSLLAEAAAAGMPVVLAQVMLYGLLAGPEPDAARYVGRSYSEYLVPDVAPAHAWWRWAQARGVSIRAVALQYALRNPAVGTALVGAQRPEEIGGIASAVAERLPEELWDEVAARIRAQASVGV